MCTKMLFAWVSLVAVLFLWKPAFSQNVDVFVCTGSNNVTCCCDRSDTPLLQDDPLFLSNIEKILTAQVLNIQNCNRLIFDQYLLERAASVQMLVLDSINLLELDSISRNIDNLVLKDIHKLLYFDRKIFRKCTHLDNLILKNVTIQNFEPLTFFEILIQNARFENVLFRNISKDSLEGQNNNSVWEETIDFKLKVCNIHDVYKLSMRHFTNKNVCMYDILKRGESIEVISSANYSHSFISTYALVILVMTAVYRYHI